MQNDEYKEVLPPTMGNTGGLIRQKNDTNGNATLYHVDVCNEKSIVKKTSFSAVMEDTVHISIWFDIEHLQELFDRLESAKKEAQNIGRVSSAVETNQCIMLDSQGMPYLDFSTGDFEDEVHVPGTVEFGGASFVMSARGFGGEDGKPYFDYVFRFEGMTFALRNHEATTSVCNGHIEFGSIPLTRHGGLPKLWVKILEVFQIEGIEILRHVIGRVDLCMDILNVPMSEFHKRYAKGKWISRARSWDESSDFARIWGSGTVATGFTRGKVLRLNCYDKLRELQDKKDETKLGVMLDKWGDYPEHVTRVEFQCKRGAIKAFSIESGLRLDTVDDWIENRASIWRYLMTDFFRMIQGKLDKENRNHSRAKTWNIWERMTREGIASLKGEVRMVKRKKRRSPINLETLGKQAVGCVITQAVYREMEGRDPLEAMYIFMEQLKLMLDEDIADRAKGAVDRVTEGKNGCSYDAFRKQVEEVLKRTEEFMKAHMPNVTKEKIASVMVDNLNRAIRDGQMVEASQRAKRNHLAKVGKYNEIESA